MKVHVPISMVAMCRAHAHVLFPQAVDSPTLCHDGDEAITVFKQASVCVWLVRRASLRGTLLVVGVRAGLKLHIYIYREREREREQECSRVHYIVSSPISHARIIDARHKCASGRIARSVPGRV